MIELLLSLIIIIVLGFLIVPRLYLSLFKEEIWEFIKQKIKQEAEVERTRRELKNKSDKRK